jgi:hypothetical protein
MYMVLVVKLREKDEMLRRNGRVFGERQSEKVYCLMIVWQWMQLVVLAEASRCVA